MNPNTITAMALGILYYGCCAIMIHALVPVIPLWVVVIIAISPAGFFTSITMMFISYGDVV